ncbi:MAG: flagellar filament capping protein FliD [Azoarcus sp.]|nr:flagellar filament capping protein FliD [Azoarcus sp.]
MANVSSLGAGSGLDLQGLLDKLMVVEREPLDRLNTQKTSYQSKVSALGTLTQKLETLQTAGKNLKPAVLQSALDKFASYKGVVADEKVASVTLGEGAISGSYALEVSQLAQAQKSRIDKNDISLGSSGQFEIAVGGQAPLSIDLSGVDSLTKLANAINQKDAGVSATVINDGSTQQLVLTGKEGQANAFTVGGTGVGGAAAVKIQDAQDAKFRLDGIDITSASNTVKDVATGVTLDLKATNVGSPTNVSVSVDYGDKLKTELENFVNAFNSTIDSVKSLGKYDADNPQSTGALNGNRVLRETQTALRDLVFQESNIQNQNGGKMTLSNLGITFNKEGKLELDSDKLAAAIKDNPSNVASFAAEMGGRFNTGLDKLVGFDGSIKNVEASMQSSITRLDERVESMTAKLLKVEERYRTQFSALDSLVTKMNSTSNYLAQQLASITANK